MLPIIDIYRRYYTGSIAWFLTWTQFVAMASAGLIVESLFHVAGWVPAERAAIIAEAHVSMNYTSILNIVFLALAGVLVWRATTTGGFRMLRMMQTPSGARGRHR